MLLSWVLVLLVLIKLPDAESSSVEKRLLDELLKEYDTGVRPVLNASEPVNVIFEVKLMKILEVKEEKEVLKVMAPTTGQWYDSSLTWDPINYDNLTEIQILENRIWTPDIYLQNAVPDVDSIFRFTTFATVQSNGHVKLTKHGIQAASCKFYYDSFPFDVQKCSFKFGSLSYDQTKLDLKLELHGEDMNHGMMDLMEYLPNSGWNLLEGSARRNVVRYTIARGPEVDLTFAIALQRRGEGIYRAGLATHAFITTTLLLSFLIPPSSTHKITFAMFHIIVATWSLLSYGTYVRDPKQRSLDSGGPLLLCFKAAWFVGVAALIANVVTFWLHQGNGPIPAWLRILIKSRSAKIIIAKSEHIHSEKLTNFNPTDVETTNEANSNQHCDWQYSVALINKIWFVILSAIQIVIWICLCV